MHKFEFGVLQCSIWRLPMTWTHKRCLRIQTETSPLEMRCLRVVTRCLETLFQCRSSALKLTLSYRAEGQQPKSRKDVMVGDACTELIGRWTCSGRNIIGLTSRVISPKVDVIRSNIYLFRLNWYGWIELYGLPTWSRLLSFKSHARTE